MGKHILVTGGAGFLGSNLLNKLIKDPKIEKITCLDNLQTGSLNNLKYLMDDKKIEILVADIIEPIDLRVDQIWNLACPASPPAYQKDPIKTLKTSIFGIVNMAELAIKNSCQLFHTSTSEVYGDPTTKEQSEDYWGNVNPVGIRSCYDEGKRAAETLLADYHRCQGLECKIVRIFNTFGPGMSPNDGRVVTNFITQSLLGEDITIYGDGTQTRSFCFVDDLIDGFMAMHLSDASIIGPVNLGNTHEFTMLEFAEKVIKLTGSKSKITFVALPQDDPKQRKPDISKAKKLLGWEPKVPLEDGLRETIKYVKTQIKI